MPTTTSTKKQAIKLVNITKRFPNGVVSNYQNNFEVKYGEIHALFGENGAGKSTLIRMIFGELPPTSGHIFINNQKITSNYNPKIANHLGIGVVHQHFALIDNFTVFENVVLGYELKSTAKRQKITESYENKKQVLLQSKKNALALCHQKLIATEDLYNRENAALKTQSLQKNETKNDRVKKLEKLIVDYKLACKKLDPTLLEKQYDHKLKSLLKWKNQKSLTNFFNHSDLREQLKKLIADFELNLNLDDFISDISVSKQQKTEILKILLRNSNIIIFDEPTSVLSLPEISKFLESLQNYKKQNKAVIFISHKINEIRQIADRVTVLQQGKVLGTFKTDEVSDEHLVELMVGGKIKAPTRTQAPVNVQKQPQLIVKNLNLTIKKRALLTNINFTIYSGEIVGIAGIEGNGQTTLLATLFGLHKPNNGQIYFFDNQQRFEISRASVTEHQAKKIVYLSQDRMKENLLLFDPLYINSVFNDLQNPQFFSKYLFNKTAAYERTQLIVDKYHVSGFKHPEQIAASLSGGNIQKFIIGRELEKNPRLVLINEPTWGVDVKSVNFLHGLMLDWKKQNKTFLFASSSIEEIVNFADRVLVMSRGKIVGILDIHKTPQIYQKIGDLISRKEN